MFTLPTGFRPAKRLTFIAHVLHLRCSRSGCGSYRPDGTVRMRNASTGGIQLLELSPVRDQFQRAVGVIYE